MQLVGISVDGLWILLSAGLPDIVIGYSSCVTISFTRGSDIILDGMHSDSQFAAGLRKPRPPSLAGRAKSSRSISLGGGFPVSVEMSSVLITFSRCWKWLLRCGRMQDK